MSGPLVLPDLSVRQQLSAKQIDAVQSAAVSIEPKNRDPQLVGSHTSERTHAVAREDKPPTTVSSHDGRRMLNEFDFHVPSVVIDPTEEARGIQVARPTQVARRNNCIRGAEILHPHPTKLDRFIVRGSPRSWFRRHSHTSRVHPTSDSSPGRAAFSRRPGSVSGES